MAAPTQETITGALIAGGAGSRLGGADKGLLSLRGVWLVRRALDALRGQTDRQLIVANRNQDRYATLGVPVLSDAWPGGAGPLAGIHTALCAAVEGEVLCAPADAPGVPPDLFARLHEARARAGTATACAHDGSSRQPLFCLVSTAAAGSAERALAEGRGSVQAWLDALGCASADFSGWPAWAWSVNTPEEWARVQELGPPS
ncbi:MAG TPA: molybdenum cofactor guanylyltransferase MobA [Solimonas sp.]|nr:molybdenum cofactor guanylyltransferase MobA [Solimonas sp.]